MCVSGSWLVNSEYFHGLRSGEGIMWLSAVWVLLDVYVCVQMLYREME